MQFDQLRRREFITVLGGAAAAWPLAARAQQMKLPTIGLLGGATPSAQAQWTAAFVQRLRELGWVEGQTVTIEYRWVEGRFERSPAIIAEFVRLKVDVIVTHATPNILAAKQVTSVVPIVFPSAGDPVGNKLVTSLARPGGNVTGLSVQSSELAQKVVDLLRDFLPKHSRLAMMHHIGNPVTALQTDAVKAAAGRFGLDVAIVEVRRAEVIAAIQALKGRADELIVPSEPLYNTNRIQDQFRGAQGTTIYFYWVYVENGPMSYWAKLAELVASRRRGRRQNPTRKQNRPISRSSSRGRFEWSLTSRPQRRSA